MRALILIALPAVLLTACERERDRDPFVVPGAMTLKSEFVGYRDGEEKVAATALGRALPRIADPCGGPDGAVGVSEAWVRSEMIAAGHPKDTFCQEAKWTRDGGRPGPDDPETRKLSIDERYARLNMRNAYSEMMNRANVEQVRILREQQLADMRAANDKANAEAKRR